MELGCGGDVWRIVGNVNGKSRSISTPVEYKDGIIRTASGSLYKVISYENQVAFEEQINKDIAKGGYEIH